MYKKLEDRLVVGCLREEKNELVGKMMRNMVSPKNILMTLKDKKNEIMTTIK